MLYFTSLLSKYKQADDPTGASPKPSLLNQAGQRISEIQSAARQKPGYPTTALQADAAAAGNPFTSDPGERNTLEAYAKVPSLYQPNPLFVQRQRQRQMQQAPAMSPPPGQMQQMLQGHMAQPRPAAPVQGQTLGKRPAAPAPPPATSPQQMTLGKRPSTRR